MTFVYFILMIGGLIAIHELGHMLVAKAFNIYVKEYSIGMGPKLFAFKGKETTYSLRLIPLGGYNAMVEQEGTDEDIVVVDDNEVDEYKEIHPDDERFVLAKSRTFYGASPLKRIATLIAGPLFNMIAAMIIFICIFTSMGQEVIYPEAIIGQVMENLPAEKAGVEVGDKIYAITYSDGETAQINDIYDVNMNGQMHNGAYTLHLLRDGQKIDITVDPVLNDEGNYVIGIVFAGEPTIRQLSFRESFKKGFFYTFEAVGLTVKSVIQLFKGSIGMENVSGTIGMYTYTQEAVSYGFTSYMSLVATISISLAVMNMIPVPAFDGGRILLCIIELIMGRRIDKKVENAILTISMILILLLFIFTTVNDIGKLIR